MDYYNIKDFLGKFKDVIFQKDEINNIIIYSIREKTQIILSPKDIKIIKGVLYINGSPTLKNEILLQKENILKDISSKITNCNITSIR